MKKTLRLPTQLILGALVSLTLALPINTQANNDGILEPASLVDRIKKQVARLSIGKEVDIVEASIYEGLNTALSYRIQSEPSYIDGYYTRLDKYRLKVDLNPMDMIDDDDEAFGFNIRKEVEVIFARQFKSQKQSITSMPYTFKNFPLNADRAKRRMNVGDFVAFETNMSVVMSVGTFKELTGSIGMGASTHAFISGEFMIHMYKMPNNHLRMKMIAIRGKGYGANGEVSADGVKIIGFKLIDRRIEDLVDLEPLKLGAGKSVHDLFMIDYVFNLNDPAAARAYDAITKKKLRFKDVEISNPVADERQLREAIVTDLDTAEEIVAQDKNLKHSDRRIHRIFKGSNELTTTSARLKIGINLAKYERGYGYGQNRVISTDLNEVPHRYLLDTFTLFSKSKLLFGLYGEENVSNTSLLYTANEDFKPGRFIALMVAQESKMKNFDEKDYTEIRDHVKHILPARYYSQINWKNWNFKKGSLSNGFYKEEAFFEPEAINYIPMKDRRNIEKSYRAYLNESGRPKALPRYGVPLDPRRYGSNWIEIYANDLEEIALQLETIFNPKTTSDVRFEAYRQLRKMPLYRETVTGYMISLLPPSALDTLMSYKLTLSSKEFQTVYYEMGHFDDTPLYESLTYVQNVVTNRSYDLRLLIGTEGEITDNSMH
ncbi:hypothetical protein [Bdellovibrio sp. HCB337]|uniref:hypothetical protein n=1 Tax=Bdellovibrio sp. HCB337 TaxID=3394358 RepID=UPI0039A4ABED